MLTSDDIKRSEQLTEEYGSGRDHVRKYPDPWEVFKRIEERQARPQLESRLAQTFVKWNKSNDPQTRAELWQTENGSQ